MGRLILRRRSGEGLSVGDKINIQVLSVESGGREGYKVRFDIDGDISVDVTKAGGHVKFVIMAPESLTILRDELTKGRKIVSPSGASAEPGPLS